MSDKPTYAVSIKLPIFGEIPLNPKVIYAELKLKEGPLWAQFFKYAVCGVLSTLVLALVYAMFRWWTPDFIADDLPKNVLRNHMALVMFAAFVPANLFAYFSNRWLVFTPGRHSFWREIIIFFVVSGVSFLGGKLAQDFIINYGAHKDIAALSFAVSSALVNFIARKFLVFAR